MKKLILDCDTGIDDALALAYAAGQGERELLGVVASYGMSYVGNTYRNSKHILRMLGCGAPVYAGSERPLKVPLRNYMEIESVFHGADGLANLLGQYRPEDLEGVRPEGGIDFIIDSVEQYGEDLVLVTTGPLTDLARVLERAPWVADRIGGVVSMVGALATPGNSNSYMEANAALDPEAVRQVLETDLPLTVVGLDVTRKTLFSRADLERWQGIGTQQAAFLSACAGHYLRAYLTRYAYLTGCALHDPLAVGVALHPEWAVTVPLHLTCVLEGEARGRTCEDLDRSGDNAPARTLGALRIDKAAFERDFFTVVESLLRAGGAG